MKILRAVILIVAVAASSSCTRDSVQPAFVFGKTSAPQIKQSSDPREILAAWKGVRRATLVYVSTVDALGPEPHQSGTGLEAVTEANFLRAACRLGYVREIFWVVPYSF